MIRLIGIDVDGTLVGSAGTVHPRVWEAAARARAHGIRLVLCSGRPAFGLALEYARHLDPEGWHVFQNGASVFKISDGQSRSTTLPSQWAGTLIARARDTGRVLELYADGDYVVESTAPWAREHAELLGVPFHPRSLESLQGPIVRAQWLVSPEEATVIAHEPHEGLEVALSTSPVMPQTRFVGLTRAGVNKGTALRTVAAALNVDLRDAMYVGDSGNDLAALQMVGHPVAMGNADSSVRSAARLVVGDVDEGGLAEALEAALEVDSR
ncbi:MAG TPA: Cof-type HAD-IIB family hydrolase [Steroidobacteraceae bacterium]